MNLIFHEKLDEFVIFYIVDILVCSKFVEEHVTHLKFVLQKFKKNKLYANRVKSEFTSLEMDFLGDVLSQERVKPNLKKIESIKEWQNLVSTKRVRSFLGLANFYMKFIKDFCGLAKPLTNFLKKNRSFEWKDEQKNVFDLLKRKLSSTLML